VTGLRPGLIAAALALAVDQATKQIALDLFQPHMRVPVLPVLDLTLAWNRGVSFGMFGGGGVPAWAFILVSLAISAVLFWQMARSETWLAKVGFGLIVGGAIGNVIDRLIYGAVVDFILLYWREWSWPVFNVADTAITCGVALILIDSLWPRSASTTSSG